MMHHLKDSATSTLREGEQGVSQTGGIAHFPKDFPDRVPPDIYRNVLFNLKKSQQGGTAGRTDQEYPSSHESGQIGTKQITETAPFETPIYLTSTFAIHITNIWRAGTSSSCALRTDACSLYKESDHRKGTNGQQLPCKMDLRGRVYVCVCVCVLLVCSVLFDSLSFSLLLFYSPFLERCDIHSFCQHTCFKTTFCK